MRVQLFFILKLLIMNEIYWITVLGNVSMLLAILCGLFCLYTIITLIASLADAYEPIDFVENINKFKLKLIIPLCVILGFAICFVPNEKQLYMIFGVGSVIDYMQDSETVKELPDKVVNALDVWVNSLNKE